MKRTLGLSGAQKGAFILTCIVLSYAVGMAILPTSYGRLADQISRSLSSRRQSPPSCEIGVLRGLSVHSKKGDFYEREGLLKRRGSPQEGIGIGDGVYKGSLETIVFDWSLKIEERRRPQRIFDLPAFTSEALTEAANRVRPSLPRFFNKRRTVDSSAEAHTGNVCAISPRDWSWKARTRSGSGSCVCDVAAVIFADRHPIRPWDGWALTLREQRALKLQS